MATLTVYPDAGTGGTTVDGDLYYFKDSQTWATVRNGNTADNGVDATSATINMFNIRSGTVLNTYSQNDRSAFTFDTSPLGATAVISAATLSVYITGKDDGLGAALTWGWVKPTLAANNNLTAADYNIANWGTTEFATRLAYASITTSAYNDFTLNASGISNISLTGVSAFGAMEGKYDIDNTTPPWGSANARNAVNCATADTAGTSQDPKLVITYTLPSPASNLSLMGVG